MKTCTKDHCTTKHYANGLCRRHYRQVWFKTPVGVEYERRRMAARTAKRETNYEEISNAVSVRLTKDARLLTVARTWLADSMLEQMLGLSALDTSIDVRLKTQRVLDARTSVKLRDIMERYYARWKDQPVEKGQATPDEIRQALDAYPQTEGK